MRITELMVKRRLLSALAIAPGHFRDPTATDAERHGFTSWLHHSFVWQNLGLGSFDDYFAYSTPTSAATLNVKRKAVGKSGICGSKR